MNVRYNAATLSGVDLEEFDVFVGVGEAFSSDSFRASPKLAIKSAIALQYPG
jgi:hypothetical protein